MANSTMQLAPPPSTSPQFRKPFIRQTVQFARSLEHLLAKESSNIHSLAIEILDIVQEVADLCDRHYSALKGHHIVEDVIFKLLKDLKLIHDDMRHQLTLRQENVVSWMDRSKIEASLMELSNLANKCRVQVLMLCGADADDQLVLAGNSNDRSLAIIRQQVQNWFSDERIVAFLGVNFDTLSRLPPTLATYHIADAYIRVQIDSIDEQLAKLSSTGSYTVEKPSQSYMAPYQLVLVKPIDDAAELRQNVLIKIQEIQELIDKDPSTVSVQAGAWKMINLCNVLDSLDMNQEAASMGLWAVNLFRTLVAADPKIYSPYLAYSLQRLSHYYTRVKDYDAAEEAVEEAVIISRRLYKHSKELEVRAQVVTALKSSAYVASLKKDNVKALEQAEEAVRLFEVMIEENRPTSEGDAPTHLHLLRTEQEWAEALANFPDQAVLSYARALQQLSYCLQDDRRAVDAVVPQVKATSIMKFISRYYPDGALEPELARMLYRVSHQQFHNFLVLEEALDYSNQGVEIYRRLFTRDAKKYGRALCDALWEQGNILGKMGRHDAAVEVWKETANLAQEILKDRLFQANALREVSWNLRRLKRHEDAAAARSESAQVYHTVLGASSFTEANTYYDLSVDYHLARRFPEAIEAAEKAVMQYRALTFKEPQTYTKNIAKGLNNLTHILSGAKEFDRAFNDGHEALKLYESLIVGDPGVLTEYSRCLALNSFTSLVSDDHHKGLDRIMDVVRHSRDIVKRFPPKQDEDSIFVRSIQNHAQILGAKLNRLDDAVAVMQEALDLYEQNPATSPKPARQHLECLIDFASLVDNDGCSEKALVPITKAIEVGKPFSDSADVASMTLGAMHRRAQLLLELGRYSEALDAALGAVAFARTAPLDNDSEFIGALLVLSMAYRYNEKAEEGIIAINEAIELCRSDKFIEFTQARSYFMLLLPQSLRQLSMNLALLGKEDEALTLARQVVDTLLDLKGRHTPLPWSEIEPAYMFSFYNLTLRLAANNELPQALEILSKFLGYFEERSKSRNGALTSLACGLVVAGFLYCAAGKHEEGIIARSKYVNLLASLQKRLPDLASLVQVEVNAETTSRSWVALMGKLDLKCTHHPTMLQ